MRLMIQVFCEWLVRQPRSIARHCRTRPEFDRNIEVGTIRLRLAPDEGIRIESPAARHILEEQVMANRLEDVVDRPAPSRQDSLPGTATSSYEPSAALSAWVLKFEEPAAGSERGIVAQSAPRDGFAGAALVTFPWISVPRDKIRSTVCSTAPSASRTFCSHSTVRLPLAPKPTPETDLLATDLQDTVRRCRSGSMSYETQLLPRVRLRP